MYSLTNARTVTPPTGTLGVFVNNSGMYTLSVAPGTTPPI